RLDGDVGSDPPDGENAGHERGIALPDRLRVGEPHAATIYRRTTTTRVAATLAPPALVARTVMRACARRPAFSKRARPEGTRSVSVLDPAASRVADVRTRRNARRLIITLPVATSEHGRSHVAATVTARWKAGRASVNLSVEAGGGEGGGGEVAGLVTV